MEISSDNTHQPLGLKASLKEILVSHTRLYTLRRALRVHGVSLATPGRKTSFSVVCVSH